MVKAIPYLLVKNGKEAIKAYEELFGAKLIHHEPFSPEIGKEFGFPDDFNYDNSTMHARLEIDGALIYLADNFMRLPGSGNVEVTLDLDSKDQMDTIYNKAKEKGYNIKMELQQTFWGAWFARFEDSDGVGWQLNYQSEQST
ncbi:MAG: VOC family protein [Promethearchaeota archaeon]|jgi:PhnB protein